MEFATCLNCMDGRVQLPVIDWIMKNYDVGFVDMITEAGMDGFLLENELDDILRKVDISLNKHGSKSIFLVGHHDCGGNPVDDITHKKQVNEGVVKLRDLFCSFEVVGLWVGSDWVVERIV